MPGLTKLYEKCRECKHKGECNNKRMVGCLVFKLPPEKSIREPLNIPTITNDSSKAPIANINYEIKIDINSNELKEQLEKDIHNQIQCGIKKTFI